MGISKQTKLVFLVLVSALTCALLLYTFGFRAPGKDRNSSPTKVIPQVTKQKLVRTHNAVDTNLTEAHTDLLQHDSPIDVTTHVQPVTDQIRTTSNKVIESGEVQEVREVTHIEFLKVHKAASSTTQGIILRFALKRNLSVVIPTPSHYISQRTTFFSDIWPPLPKPKMRTEYGVETTDERDACGCPEAKYDILSHHMVFNHRKVSQLLHHDTKYIAIVREPLEQFLSAAYYYKYAMHAPYLERLNGDTFITDLVRDPKQFEATDMSSSRTFNSMSYDFGFGFSVRNAENITDEQLNGFLKETADTFHLVMVVDQFEESLILMKRYLRWSLKDIIYFKLNTLSSQVELDGNATRDLNETDLEIFKKRNRLDYAVYKYFKNRLNEQIKKEKDFMEEVSHFKAILKDVHIFCSDQSINKSEEHKDKNGKETFSNMNKLVEYITKTFNLSQHQQAEMIRLSKLVNSGSIKINIDKLSKILKLLLNRRSARNTNEFTFRVPDSKWNGEFNVTSSDCELISKDILTLYELVKQQHIHLLVLRKFESNYSIEEAVQYIAEFF